MSATAITGVLDRTMTDEAFLDRFRADPEAALADYDLTDEEVAALREGDEIGIREAAGIELADWDIAIVVVVT